MVEPTFKPASETQNIVSKTEYTYIDLILLIMIWYDMIWYKNWTHSDARWNIAEDCIDINIDNTFAVEQKNIFAWYVPSIIYFPINGFQEKHLNIWIILLVQSAPNKNIPWLRPSFNNTLYFFSHDIFRFILFLSESNKHSTSQPLSSIPGF
jgi:hypothetical protein